MVVVNKPVDIAAAESGICCCANARQLLVPAPTVECSDADFAVFGGLFHCE
jgi:hypothetical protein